MAKRGINIYKRRDGRWEGRYKCGYTAEGKAKYRSVYEKSYSAVRELLERRKAESEKGARPCRCTVGELVDMWLSDLSRRVKESTRANYSMKLRKHILPYFSGMRYEALTAECLNVFIKSKLDSGLSEKYVADIIVLLKSAARYAGRSFGYANRIEYVTLPKSREKTEKPLLSPTEQEKLRQYRETSGAYVFKKEVFEKYHRRVGANPYIKEVGVKEAVDINYPEDFQTAQLFCGADI